MSSTLEVPIGGYLAEPSARRELFALIVEQIRRFRHAHGKPPAAVKLVGRAESDEVTPEAEMTALEAMREGSK